MTISDTKHTLHIVTTTAPENFNTQETKEREVISALTTERKSPPDSPNAISYRASLKSLSKLDRSFRREEEMIKKVHKIVELRQEDTDIFGNERLFATETRTKLTENGSLVRFVDNMILNGGLPTEAIQFFHPEGKGKSVTSPERKKIDPIDNVPNLIIIDAKGRRKIKRMNPKLDVIPGWLRSNTDYKSEYNNRPPKNRTPLMDILDRDPELKRENSDIQILAKFLGTLDMFINFPWNALEKLSHKIRGIKCDEGQFLRHEGDLADGLFIIYAGGLNIVKEESGFVLGKCEKNDIIGKKSANEPSVRRYRTAALVANKESYIVSLSFNDYEEIAREFSDLQFSQNKLHDYFFHHPFFSNFQESKLIHLISRSTPQKVYKNDVIYKMGDEANFMYIFLKGNVVREVPVKREKTNQWPTAMKGWKVNTILQNYTIVLPLEAGEIFGIREIVYAGRRQEKVLVLDDSFIISIHKEDFNSSISFLKI
jgi:CRP-like cAMP-binding protein